MAYRVVCVSGPDGAQMREVASGLATRLGFTLVDEGIVLRAAADAGLEPEVVASAETRRSFMDRALGALGTSLDGATFAVTGAGALAVAEPQVSDELRDLIRAAIEETADRGKTVIVAHAASHALASKPDVLRVLITASPSVRRGRVAVERDLSERDAARCVDRPDAASADYLQSCSGA